MHFTAREGFVIDSAIDPFYRVQFDCGTRKVGPAGLAALERAKWVKSAKLEDGSKPDTFILIIEIDLRELPEGINERNKLTTAIKRML